MTFRPYNLLQSVNTSDQRENNTGATMTKATPVRINTSGEIDFIDVSVEANSIGAMGVTGVEILNGTFGDVVSSGKIVDIPTSASFGDTLWVSKTGGLTNIKPSIGVNGFVTGDLSILVGVVAKNESNPSLKDLYLTISIKGQL